MREDEDGAQGGEGFAGDEESEVDPAKAAHDEAAVSNVLAQAYVKAKDFKIVVTEAERRTARGLFNKVRALSAPLASWCSVLIARQVAGLARRVHDSAVLREKFDTIVAELPAVSASAGAAQAGDRRTLTRRVATRWNSDLACLSAHIHFKDAVQELILQDPSLSQYSLNDAQWSLATQLEDVLKARVILLVSNALTAAVDL